MEKILQKESDGGSWSTWSSAADDKFQFLTQIFSCDLLDPFEELLFDFRGIEYHTVHGVHDFYIEDMVIERNRFAAACVFFSGDIFPIFFDFRDFQFPRRNDFCSDTFDYIGKRYRNGIVTVDFRWCGGFAIPLIQKCFDLFGTSFIFHGVRAQ